MITVLIADDQALVRAGFRALLDTQADITVVGEASDGDEAVRLAIQHRPDVVLMDVRMPGSDGLVATRRIADDERLKEVGSSSSRPSTSTSTCSRPSGPAPTASSSRTPSPPSCCGRCEPSSTATPCCRRGSPGA